MVKTADKNLKQHKDYGLSKGYFQTLLTFLYKDVINKDTKDRADSKPPIDSLFNNNLTKKTPIQLLYGRKDGICTKFEKSWNLIKSFSKVARICKL